MKVRNTNLPFLNYAEDAVAPQVLVLSATPDGDAEPWASAPVGTIQYRAVPGQDGHVQTWMKFKDGDLDNDWRIIEGRICAVITKSQFTDGGSTAGTYATSFVLPVGAYVDPFILHTTTAWSGDTSAEFDLGDGSDADRFNSATAPSIFATGVVTGGTPSGTNPVASAATLTITVTSATDFTAVASGVTLLSLRYRT